MHEKNTMKGNAVNVFVGLFLVAGGLVTALNVGNRVDNMIRDHVSHPRRLDRVWPWKREAALDPETRIRRRVTSFRFVGAILACAGAVEAVTALAR